MHLRGRIEVTAVDVTPFAAALPMVLAGWRALTFPDGAVRHPVTGMAHEGLRLVEGVHPHPGAVYRLVVREDEPPEPTPEEALVAHRLDAAEPQAADAWEPGRDAAARASGRTVVKWHTFTVTLGTDDAQRTTFAVHDTETGTRARIDLNDPARPGPVDLALEVFDFGATSALLRGTMEILLRLDTGRLPPYGGGKPPLVATVTHPRGRAHADVGIASAAGRRWSVTAEVDVRGSGWARPLVGLFAPFLKGPAQRGLDEMLSALPAAFDQLAAELAKRYPSPPDPHALAAQLLADLITEVPVTLPLTRCA